MYLLLTRMNHINEKIFKTKTELLEVIRLCSLVFPEMEHSYTCLGGDQMKTTKKKTTKKTTKKAKKK